MSYLSPQAGEIIASNDHHQPNDLPRDGWASTPNALGAAHGSQETPWTFRQPPRLRQNHRA